MLNGYSVLYDYRPAFYSHTVTIGLGGWMRAIRVQTNVLEPIIMQNIKR